MPTIKARRQANGSTRYTAIVRIRREALLLERRQLRPKNCDVLRAILHTTEN